MIVRALALLVLFNCMACQPLQRGNSGESEADNTSNTEADHYELAPKMASLHYFQRKLGYAIEARNSPLSGFYLHELEETLVSIVEEVPSYEGFPIGSLTSVMTLPKLEKVEKALNEDVIDWSFVKISYESVVTSCNACHRTTEHGFIEVKPSPSDNPFDQAF